MVHFRDIPGSFTLAKVRTMARYFPQRRTEEIRLGRNIAIKHCENMEKRRVATKIDQKFSKAVLTYINICRQRVDSFYVFNTAGLVTPQAPQTLHSRNRSNINILILPAYVVRHDCL